MKEEILNSGVSTRGEGTKNPMHPKHVHSVMLEINTRHAGRFRLYCVLHALLRARGGMTPHAYLKAADGNLT